MTDPGADRLVRLLDESIPLEDRGIGRYTSIRVGPLLNQSHASMQEFQRLQSRLTELLRGSGRARGLVFIDDPDEPTDYELRATVYIITAQGFDQWELYFSLRPTNSPWEMWRSNGPVRMLRQQRPGGPQLMLRE